MTRSSLAMFLVLAGCAESHQAVSDGGGVCCPITAFEGCSPGADPLPAGGWAPSAAECTFAIAGWEGWPWVRITDTQGCPVMVEDHSYCCGCVFDAGGPDAGTSACAGLAPAACLAAFCVPQFDDACCPSCGPGPCADCTDPTYLDCYSQEESSCRGGGACGQAPIWACGPAGSSCASAHVVDLDSCDVTGCVPAYPSSEGEPDLSSATCHPILGSSCSFVCRQEPPACPNGTYPEGDGACYTGFCIPVFVCRR